jgi:5-methylcytosine-specific restriction endonuclease McrA
MKTKVCSGPCGEEKDINEFYVNKNGRIYSRCKECEKNFQRKRYKENKEKILKRNRKNRENNIESIRESNRKSARKRRAKIKKRLDKLFNETPENTTKICSKCGEEKDISEFYKGSGKYGRRSQCIICYNGKVSEYRENNKEKILETGKKYYQKHKKEKRKYYEDNKDSINEYQNKYREKHKEGLRQRRKEYRKNNREKIRARKKKYYENNKEKILEKSKKFRQENPHLEANKRARRLVKIGDAEITKDEWLAIMKSNNWRCFYCEEELTKDNRSIDHVIPLAIGGAHELFNLVPSCIPCNSSKGDRKLKDWNAFHKLTNFKQNYLKYIESSYGNIPSK